MNDNKLLDQGIKFFKSLKESNFCRKNQTKGSSKSQIGKTHCAYGHLFLNPSSPFYVKSFAGRVGTTRFPKRNTRAIRMHQLVDSKLANTNNEAPSGTIKATCIAFLEGKKTI